MPSSFSVVMLDGLVVEDDAVVGDAVVVLVALSVVVLPGLGGLIVVVDLAVAVLAVDVVVDGSSSDTPSSSDIS